MCCFSLLSISHETEQQKAALSQMMRSAKETKSEVVSVQGSEAPKGKLTHGQHVGVVVKHGHPTLNLANGTKDTSMRSPSGAVRID